MAALTWRHEMGLLHDSRFHQTIHSWHQITAVHFITMSDIRYRLLTSDWKLLSCSTFHGWQILRAPIVRLLMLTSTCCLSTTVETVNVNINHSSMLASAFGKQAPSCEQQEKFFRGSPRIWWCTENISWPYPHRLPLLKQCDPHNLRPYDYTLQRPLLVKDCNGIDHSTPVLSESCIFCNCIGAVTHRTPLKSNADRWKCSVDTSSMWHTIGHRTVMVIRRSKSIIRRNARQRQSLVRIVSNIDKLSSVAR